MSAFGASLIVKAACPPCGRTDTLVHQAFLSVSVVEGADFSEAFAMAGSEIFARVGASGAITATDALAVRRSVYGGDVAITPDEMQRILQADAGARTVDPSWTELLTEAGADFLVNQQPPSGYVSEDNAAWLTQRICREGIVDTERQLQLLVHI